MIGNIVLKRILQSSALVILIGIVLGTMPVHAVDPYGPADAKWTIVVMDPMAGPLACDCVKGYAQRKYEKLADYLQAKTKQSFRVVWSESLADAIDGPAAGKAHFVFGKDSVVRAAAAKVKIPLEPMAQLTDMKGSVMQHGLFVVRSECPAATLLDLENYEVLWGPEDCDEKYAAPRAALKESEVVTKDGPICASCSVAAKQLMEMDAQAKAVAVISSYAAPLLEGCGTIKKGDLKVVGASSEVPFIIGFADSRMPSDIRRTISEALLAMKSTEMLKAMETKEGFVPYEVGKPSAPEKKRN